MTVDILKKSLVDAIRNLSRVFDRDQEMLPFFGVTLLDSRPHFYHTGFFDAPHLAGRALDALLMTEATAGLAVPENVIDTYRRYLFKSFAGEDGLNGWIDTKTGKRCVYFHNLREGLLGLRALILWRDDRQAGALADRMIQRLIHFVQDDGDWNQEAIGRDPAIDPLGRTIRHDAYYPSTAGRLIGALVKYYETTQRREALDLAIRIKNYVLKTCFRDDGVIREPQAGWHVHSITATIHSIAQLARTLGDSNLMNKAEQLYQGAFQCLITRFGWSRESLANHTDVGEINNTGDMIQTALILAENGRTQYYDDVERMLRCHVLPAQLQDTEWIQEVDDPHGDDEQGIRNRIPGAFGFPAPYGLKANNVDFLLFNFDITCGAMQALCEVLPHRQRVKPEGTEVNLLFCGDPASSLRQNLIAEGTLEVVCQRPIELRVRIPSWSDPRQTQISCNDHPVPFHCEGGYIRLEKRPSPAVYRITWPLSEYVTEENIHGKVIRVQWRGDQIVSMQPEGEFLPFLTLAPA